MALLKNVRVGWASLGGLLNDIIDVVNSLQPIAGSGMNIEEQPYGTIYSLADQKGSGGGGDNSQTNAGGAQLTEIDWHGVKWQTVIVVDPSSCAQSTLTVLTSTGNTDDVVVIEVASQ